MKVQTMFRQLTFLLLVAAAISGCSFEDPDFGKPSNFRITTFKGQHLEGEFTIECDNPNGVGFKMKKADIDVIVEDQTLGTITLNKKVKIKRKSKNTYTIPLVLDLADGALFRILRLSGKDKVQISLRGKVRGSVCGFSKSFPVNETRTIDGSFLRQTQQLQAPAD